MMSMGMSDDDGQGDDLGDGQPGADGEVEQRRWEDRGIHLIGGLALAAVGVGTLMYRWMEGWGWVDSLYFSVVTLTTVGYGDLSPTSPGSKLFTVFYIIGGISLFGAFLNNVMKRRARRTARRRASK
jgi:hypothetical protein